MGVRVWIRFLLGTGRAIREVAESRSALWTGIILVQLTAIARNYDQTFIAEAPIRWLFGPLGFSFVSGTWLYGVTYASFGRWRMQVDGRRPEFFSGWRSFMGLFWMTAPVAWLYAIPVERFLDPVTATKANVALLAVVSLWRVLLISRVLQYLTTAPFLMALIWVLFAAMVEVLVVFMFGGHFASAIMQAMGGMRNSPAEEVMRSAVSTALSVALISAPVAFLLSFLPVRRVLTPLPTQTQSRLPTTALSATALLWILVAIYPQIELSRSVTVETLMAKGKPRAALDYMGQFGPEDFAPSRTLPPKPYERTVFEQLPQCFGVVQASDERWLRAHLMARLNIVVSHYRTPLAWWQVSETREDELAILRDGLHRLGPDVEGLLELIHGLERLPEGQTWLRTNEIFIEALQITCEEPVIRGGPSARSETAQRRDWLQLSNTLMRLPLGRSGQTHTVE